MVSGFNYKQTISEKMRRGLAPFRASFLRRRPFSSTADSQPPPSSALSPRDIDEVNGLIRRLCDGNHFQEAIRLLSTALLAAPPPALTPSLPLLVDRISSLPGPDMSQAMSLLTALRHHNPPPSPAIPLCSALLVSSYLRRRRPKDAHKVFAWLLREDTPCRPDEETYRLVLGGVCGGGGGRAAEAVRVVREMVRDGVMVGDDVRGLLRSRLLTEARVDLAKELDAALAAAAGDGGGGGGVGELLDRMISEWEE